MKIKFRIVGVAESFMYGKSPTRYLFFEDTVEVSEEKNNMTIEEFRKEFVSPKSKFHAGTDKGIFFCGKQEVKGEEKLSTHSSKVLNFDIQLKAVVFVRTLTGKTFTFPFESSMLVDELKEMVVIRLGLTEDIKSVRLIFAGKNLTGEGKTLGDFLLSNFTTLHLVTKIVE